VGAILIYAFYHPGKINDLYYPVATLAPPAFAFIYTSYNPLGIRNYLGSNLSILSFVLMLILYSVIIVIMVSLWKETRRNKD
jgi:hypothetical protein